MKNKKRYLVVSLKALVAFLLETSALRRVVCLKIPALSENVSAHTPALIPKYFELISSPLLVHLSIPALLIAQDEQLITMVCKE